MLFLVNGCDTGTSGATIYPPPEAGSMTATVNGQPWAFTLTEPLSATGEASATLNKPLIGGLTIAGVSYVNSLPISDIKSPIPVTITITLIHPHFGADSMSIANSFDPNTGSFLYGANTKDAYVTIPSQGDTGSINITNYDTTNKLISGTFSFSATQMDTMTHTIQVTNGSFYDVSW